MNYFQKRRRFRVLRVLVKGPTVIEGVSNKIEGSLFISKRSVRSALSDLVMWGIVEVINSYDIYYKLSDDWSMKL